MFLRSSPNPPIRSDTVSDCFPVLKNAMPAIKIKKTTPKSMGSGIIPEEFFDGILPNFTIFPG